jgi:plasmid stabilization system protein ParE
MHIKYRIIITPRAINEISKIYDYILNELYAEKAARKLVQEVEETIQELKYSPKIYARIEKLDDVKRRYRRIVIRNFVILYTVDEEHKTVYVAHMYYSGRNYLDLI